MYGVYRSLFDLLSAAKEAGYDLRVQSAFRTVHIQNRLWAKALDKYDFNLDMAAFRSAPPCFSEHATGKVVDISLPSVEENLAEHEAYQWLKENAPKYGWIQSFKEGEPGITRDPLQTGISVEEWHWRHKTLKP